MKISRNQKPFTPVVITIETQDELKAFKSLTHVVAHNYLADVIPIVRETVTFAQSLDAQLRLIEG